MLFVSGGDSAQRRVDVRWVRCRFAQKRNSGDLVLKPGDCRSMIPVCHLPVATEWFDEFILAEDRLQTLRDGHPRSEPTVLLFPVTPLRRHP